MARYGGKRHRGSGSSQYRRGDGRRDVDDWTNPAHSLHEMKRTDKKQITLKSEDLKKIFDEAVVENRFACLNLELDGRHYVVIERGVMEEWIERLTRETRDVDE